MSVITIPVSDVQKGIIEDMVKSGRAASKAHAVRMAIDLLAREEALEGIRQGRRDIKEGKMLKGDLEELAKLVK
jgi:Arc/MetJ-type ribon-helix-helix transcriptional regulator